MKTKKRRSQAPVALVYFLTVIIFMGLLSLLSIYLLKQFNIIDTGNQESEPVPSVTFNNLYARVNSKGVLSDLAVVRISPDTSKIVVIPIPSLTQNKGSNQTLREVYENGGILKLKEAVTNTFGVEIDSYLSITNSAFETVADIMGGISYSPNEELYYISQESDENDIFISQGEFVNLSGRQIRLLFQYPVYESGKQGNLEFQGYALGALINTAFQQSNITIDNLDNIYNIITENSDTDLSLEKYKLQRSYVKEMLSKNLTPAEILSPVGTWAEGDAYFTVSEEFSAQVEQMLSRTAPVSAVSSEE